VGEDVAEGRAQFSDDGQWLTYRQEVAEGRYDLVLYGIADETGRVIARNAFRSGVGWSPDSVWLARIQGESERANHLELVLYNVLTAEESIFSFDSPMSLSSFAWSPDGRHIALAVAMDTLEYTEVTILSVPNLDVVYSVPPILARVEVVWSPSGQSLIVTVRDSADFALLDLTAQPITLTQVRLDASAPRYFWSPDRNYLIVYHSSGDLATAFTLLNSAGDVLADAWVSSSLYDFVAQHWWIDTHHVLISEWDNGFDALVLVDARTGERQTLFNPIAEFELSPDHELVALVPLATVAQGFEASQEVQFYARSGETFTLARTVTMPDEPRSILWRADRSELIVLFEDQSLRAYHYDTETWRSITTLPDTDSWSMGATACFR
jgi:hypothetical protein